MKNNEIDLIESEKKLKTSLVILIISLVLVLLGYLFGQVLYHMAH